MGASPFFQRLYRHTVIIIKKKNETENFTSTTGGREGVNLRAREGVFWHSSTLLILPESNCSQKIIIKKNAKVTLFARFSLTHTQTLGKRRRSGERRNCATSKGIQFQIWRERGRRKRSATLGVDCHSGRSVCKNTKRRGRKKEKGLRGRTVSEEGLLAHSHAHVVKKKLLKKSAMEVVRCCLPGDDQGLLFRISLRGCGVCNGGYACRFSLCCCCGCCCGCYRRYCCCCCHYRSFFLFLFLSLSPSLALSTRGLCPEKGSFLFPLLALSHVIARHSLSLVR